MARPKICRKICVNPKTYYFKPRGIPLMELDEVKLEPEEFEALRLKDYEKKSQIEASEIMKISQPTFHRIYTCAKEKIIKAIVEGLAISIQKDNNVTENKR
ncbi:MAG: DUF134 domain-containing protein [Candidatus Methanofastidiosia archaeon]